MYRIGVDLGGTKISAGITDEKYCLLAKASCPTGPERKAEDIMRDIAKICREAAASAGADLKEVISIGIASPGAIDSFAGILSYSCNLPSFTDYPMAEMLSSLTGVKNVYLENDANAAALGEAVAGAAKGYRSSVMITLGTGVGGGIILDGKILTGFNGAAGELGHMVIEHNGAPCPCGRVGCFEAYSSATALTRLTREEMEKCRRKGEATVMEAICEGDIQKAGPRTAFEAMKKGDAAGGRVVDKFIEYLAVGVTNLINIFQPEVFIIGGGLSGEKNYLTDPLIPIVEREQYTRGYKRKTEIKIAQLGNDAGIIGAAALGC